MDGEKFLIVYVVLTCGQILSYFLTESSSSIGGVNVSSVSEPKRCTQFNTCAYVKTVYFPNCYCDDLCHIYDDCCIDHNLSDEQLRSIERLDTKERQSVSKEECMPLYGKFYGTYVVRNCENSSQNVTRDTFSMNKRTDIFDILPVTSSNNIVFKNRYEAECHGLTEYKFWKLLFDVTFCSLEGSVQKTGFSTTDIANDFLEQGCEYTVLPSEQTRSRFCIIFLQDKNVTINLRVPIRTSAGIFRSLESCIEYMTSEVHCLACNNIRFDEQFASKFGRSMNALFTFAAIKQGKRDTTIKSTESAKVLFRNLKLKRQINATSSGVFIVTQWDRAAFFYKTFMESALKDLEPYLDFYNGIYFENKSSYSGKFSSLFDIHLRKEIHSEMFLSEISTWLDSYKVQYIEKSENGTNLYEITSPRPDSTRGCSECKFIGYFKHEYDYSVKIIKLMKNFRDFPTRDCLEVQGRLLIVKGRYSFSVKCQRHKVVQFNQSEMETLSTIQYVLLCSSSMFLCSVLPCYLKHNLRNTVLGYSYLLLIFVSFLNQAVTTFIAHYSTLNICYAMKLVSRLLSLVSQTTALMGSASFVYVTIGLKSTANEALLKNRVHTCVLFGVSVLAPIVLTLLVNLLSKSDSEVVTTCVTMFLSNDTFSYVMVTLVFALIVLVVVGIAIYKTKANEHLSLIKGCIRFEFSFATIAVPTSIFLIVQYFEGVVDLQIKIWVYVILTGLQIPFLAIPFFIPR